MPTIKQALGAPLRDTHFTESVRPARPGALVNSSDFAGRTEGWTTPRAVAAPSYAGYPGGIDVAANKAQAYVNANPAKILYQGAPARPIDINGGLDKPVPWVRVPSGSPHYGAAGSAAPFGRLPDNADEQQVTLTTKPPDVAGMSERARAVNGMPAGPFELDASTVARHEFNHAAQANAGYDLSLRPETLRDRAANILPGLDLSPAGADLRQNVMGSAALGKPNGTYADIPAENYQARSSAQQGEARLTGRRFETPADAHAAFDRYKVDSRKYNAPDFEKAIAPLDQEAQRYYRYQRSKSHLPPAEFKRHLQTEAEALPGFVSNRPPTSPMIPTVGNAAKLASVVDRLADSAYPIGKAVLNGAEPAALGALLGGGAGALLGSRLKTEDEVEDVDGVKRRVPGDRRLALGALGTMVGSSLAGLHYGIPAYVAGKKLNDELTAAAKDAPADTLQELGAGSRRMLDKLGVTDPGSLTRLEHAGKSVKGDLESDIEGLHTTKALRELREWAEKLHNKYDDSGVQKWYDDFVRRGS